MATMSVREIFDLFDSDGNGELDQEELKEVFWRPGDEPLSDAEVEAIMAEFDADGNGVIDFEEFSVMWGERGTGSGSGSDEADSGGTAAEALFVAREQLRMRSGRELNSKMSGSLQAGSIVRVRERATLPNGVCRACVASPEDESAAPMGWVSVYARDGFENLRALKAEHREMLSAIAANPNMHRRATFVEAMINLDMPSGVVTASATTSAAPASAAGGGPTHKSEHELWLGAVRRCVLLSNLSAAEINYVGQAARTMLTNPGDVIFSQGDTVVQVGGSAQIASGRAPYVLHPTSLHPTSNILLPIQRPTSYFRKPTSYISTSCTCASSLLEMKSYIISRGPPERGGPSILRTTLLRAHLFPRPLMRTCCSGDALPGRHRYLSSLR